MNILHLGAGRVGLGLIVPFFSSDNEVVVVDRNETKVTSIEKNGGYNLHAMWYGKEAIEKITKFSISTYKNYQYDSDVDLITTSVIVRNLPDVAPFIASVIKNNSRHIYIAPMENSYNASEVLDAELQHAGIDVDRYTVLRSVIDKIVPRYDGLLDVIGEPFSLVRIQYHPDFADICQGQKVLSKDLKLEAEMKLLLVNGLHASAAYWGFLHGYHFISDVLASKLCQDMLEDVGHCYIDFLQDLYGCDPAELEQVLENTLERFGNFSIKDPLDRVGRNLMIKLAPNERIKRPLEYNKSRGLRYKSLELIVKAAAEFKIGNDFMEYRKSIL